MIALESSCITHSAHYGSENYFTQLHLLHGLSEWDLETALDLQEARTAVVLFCFPTQRRNQKELATATDSVLKEDARFSVPFSHLEKVSPPEGLIP